MFTVEFENDEVLVTVIDSSGEIEDVSAILYDDYCYLRQWDEDTQQFIVIALTAEMYTKLMLSWTSAQGAYIIDRS